jgi:hypothetical protein
VALHDLQIQASASLMKLLITEFNSADWGLDSEHRRPLSRRDGISYSLLIKPYVFDNPTQSAKMQAIFTQAVSELTFPEPMFPIRGEMTLMFAKSTISWHCDFVHMCKYSTRVMLPFINNDDVDYYFASWTKDTPIDRIPNPVPSFIDQSSVNQFKMKTGHFYIFNQRVPHRTVNRSLRARGLITIDLLPETMRSTYTGNEFKTLELISEFEKSKLL